MRSGRAAEPLAQLSSLPVSRASWLAVGSWRAVLSHVVS
jgi:hypothetical protein